MAKRRISPETKSTPDVPTERSRAEEALQEAQGDLEGLVKARTTELLQRIDALSSESAERKQTEEALHESEERFRLLAEQAQDIIFRYRFTEPRGHDYVSPALMAVAGYTPEEFYADPEFVLKVIHPDSRGAFEQMVRERLTDPVELRWVRKDGSVIWTEQRNVPIYDDSGVLIAMEGIVRDITERKRAEEALRESEAQWRSLVENAPDVIMTVDRDGVMQFINRTVPGISVEDALGSSVYDYAPPDQHAPMREAYERVFQTGETVSYESTGLGPHGTTSWYSVRVGPIKCEGQVVALTVIATDITERRRAEEALRESEEEFRLAFENAKDAIFWADPETGLITKCNRAAETLLEKNRDEIIGQHQTALHAPQEAEYYAKMFKSHLGREGTVDEEAEIITKSGRIRPVHITSSVTSVGRRPIIQGIFRDISERKWMEEALQRAREELEGKVERQMVRRNPYGLTFREFTVLHHVATGRADKEIARELGISPLTASKHVSNILAKMNAASRTDAGVRAVREGLLE